VPGAIDEAVNTHQKWLMKKLYNSREHNGDVHFVFQTNDPIFVPQHPLAALNQGNDAIMKDEQSVKIKCHRNVLVSQSEYF